MGPMSEGKPESSISKGHQIKMQEKTKTKLCFSVTLPILMHLYVGKNVSADIYHMRIKVKGRASSFRKHPSNISWSNQWK